MCPCFRSSDCGLRPRWLSRDLSSHRHLRAANAYATHQSCTVRQCLRERHCPDCVRIVYKVDSRQTDTTRDNQQSHILPNLDFLKAIRRNDVMVERYCRAVFPAADARIFERGFMLLVEVSERFDKGHLGGHRHGRNITPAVGILVSLGIVSCYVVPKIERQSISEIVDDVARAIGPRDEVPCGSVYLQYHILALPKFGPKRNARLRVALQLAHRILDSAPPSASCGSRRSRRIGR